MSFVLNDAQQMTLFETEAFLSKRKQRMLQNSWPQAFSDCVFTKIDETIFAPLYSSNSNSRPNSPVNVIIGAMILKEYKGLTDDEIIEEMELDDRYKYALHTMSYDEQPISDRTFSRFRERVAAYELTTGIDLIHECISGLAEDMAKFMEIDPTIRRMDSMMVEANIRRLSRLDLMFTCLANLVRTMRRDGRSELLDGFEVYEDPNGRNKVAYHDKDTPQDEKMQKVVDDASRLVARCGDEYSESPDYLLLMRALDEQTKDGGDGRRIPKAKGDGMGSGILQNPSDPDATYREKAGKQHRGYVANITETVDENGSIITDYQYDVNTRSDESFIAETLDAEEAGDERKVIITDGAYSSDAVNKLAAEKNVSVLSTGLSNNNDREILAHFQASEDEASITACPAGNAPKSCSHTKKTDSMRVSFLRSQCEGCPHQCECHPKLGKRTAVVTIPMKSRRRLLSGGRMDDNLRIIVGRIRNGAETVPSVMRRKYNVDRMPVRGKLRTKQFFGFKVAALNFSKLVRFLDGKEKCRAFYSKLGAM